jgi:hypothetical protein
MKMRMKMRMKMKIIKQFCILMIIFLICNLLGIPNITADKGSVSVEHVDIPIYEPGQKAIICWDGTTELLILSTDIRASQPTKALEIMPLPAEPEIFTCNWTVFERLRELVEVRAAGSEDRGKGLGGGNSDSAEPVEVEILFHKELGIHNITVVKALTTDGFANWVNNFMVELGLQPMSFPKAERIAKSYMNRGINYFVLDVVDLTQELQSPQPLLYKFKSSSIYYPMEITSLTGGESHIVLFILTPYEVVKGPYDKHKEDFFSETVETWVDEKYFNVEPPASPVRFNLVTTSYVSVSRLGQMSSYNYNADGPDQDFKRIYEFFINYQGVQVGVYEYDGPVEMEGDIEINQFSVQSVKTDDEYQYKVTNFLLIFTIPPILLVIFVVVLIIYMSRKYNKTKNN